jgi:hypothetical protein
MHTEIKVTAAGKEMFSLAMQISMNHFKNIEAYKIDKGHLVLSWCFDEKFPNGYSKLPYKMNVGQAIDFVWGWLLANEPMEREPDTDGSTGKGFRLYHRDFNAYESDTYSLLHVRPIWMVYGK